MDWSDHALWWPSRNIWLTRTRSTLDQCGVQADALLHFTPMHKKLRVQMPDLRYLEMRVDFSIKTFSTVIHLCKQLGIRHPEELSLCKPLEPYHLKHNYNEMPKKKYENGTAKNGHPHLPPDTNTFIANSSPDGSTGSLDKSTLMCAPVTPSKPPPTSTPISSPAGNTGSWGRQGFGSYSNGFSPDLSTSISSEQLNGSYDSSLAQTPPKPSPEARKHLIRPKSLVEKARMNVAWLDSSLSIMEQGVREFDTLCLRFKFYVFYDLNPKYDAIRINQIYEQAKWQLLNEEIDCTEEEMLMFAALQLNFRPAMSDVQDLEEFPDRMAEIFVNKTVLLSGGSGFVGKVFIEKLLRSCTDVKKIYLLIRTKRDKDPNDRLREIFNGPLFDLLRKTQGREVFKKVEAISADLSAPDLALSVEDRKKLAEEVNFIYHCAATIRFDEALQKAVFLNVRGTKLMLELAKECKNLEGFVHLSTAYCHLHERILYEKAYPPPANPHYVIKTCEWLSEEVLDIITPKILGDIPNTYAFTKALGEALVVDEMDNLPIGIIRPSVIIPIWKEPLPGWTDNINGPTGLLIGAGKGVIRSMYCKGDTYADYVPVDIVANCLICGPYFFKTTEKRICNLTSSAEYKVTFEEIIDIGRNIISEKMPLNGVMWYPGGSMKKSRFLHNIDYYLFQWIPAVFLDVLLVLLGYKPILKRVQQKVSKGYEVFEYYANNQWDFNNDESMEMRKMLNPKEKTKYKLDGDGVNYESYFYDCIHAARLYLLNEPDDTLPAARRHMKIMWFADTICKTLIIFGFFYLLYKHLLTPFMRSF